MKKKVIFICILFIIIYAVLIFQRIRIQFVDELYVQLFKKSMIFKHYNNKGQLDGDYISYINGKVYAKSHFKDGLTDGLNVWYNEKTGKKEQELFYKKGKAEGEEYQYYENGMLNYKGFWKNGKRYGGLYWYSTEGKLQTYTTYDISEHLFLICHYDRFGSIIHVSKALISPVIYSSDARGNSIILLKKNDTVHKIKNLYLTVATPPGLNPKFNISIDNVPINYQISNNTITINKDRFNNRKSFILKFYSEFLDNHKNLIRSPICEYEIFQD